MCLIIHSRASSGNTNEVWLFEIDVLNDSDESVIDVSDVIASTDFTDTLNPGRDQVDILFNGDTGALYSSGNYKDSNGTYSFCGFNDVMTVNFSTSETVSKVQVYIRDSELTRLSGSQLLLVDSNNTDTVYIEEILPTYNSDTDGSNPDYYLVEYSV